VKTIFEKELIMAVVDYFLKIDGIDGESEDSKHKNEIHLESFHWGAQQVGSSAADGGLGAGKIQMRDFSFVSRTSKASPKLMDACDTGSHIKKAVLTCRKAGTTGQEYLIYTLTDLLVSSYSISGSPTDVIPMDTFTLNFTQIEMEYKPQKADGTLDAAIKKGYNLKNNKAV
jgi:type VI secretion system secreted protein Hcp